MKMRASLLLVAALFGPLTSFAFARQLRVEKPNPMSVVVTGPGPSPWQLRYGSLASEYSGVLVLSIGTDRALFAHGIWMRLLDTKQGTVLGRWRFPNSIVGMALRPDGAADVSIALPSWMRTTAIKTRFDPAAPVVPNWDVGALIIFRTAESEGAALLGGGDPWTGKQQISADMIAAADEAVRRDPHAPFLRLALAKALQDRGDARASAAFEDVFNTTSTEFSEWFRISAILDRLPTPHPELATRAFERAMTDFIRRDRDPRLLESLIARLILYPVGVLIKPTEASRSHFLERIYQIAPYGEGTIRAWPAQARALERQGDPASAIWRQRAEESAQQSLTLFELTYQMRHDQLFLLGIGCIVAAVLLITNRSIKYHQQSRVHALAEIRSGARAPASFRLFGLRYWTRRERWTLMLILVAGWFALGAASSYMQILGKGAALPIHIGSINGYEKFESNYPDTPERVLLQALGASSIGDVAEAEKLYRSTPQFAESWNNLGVIQARSGRIDESRQSFARALEIDPTLPEAILNTSGETRTLVMQALKKYAPDAKHISIPSRDRLFTAYVGDLWTHPWLSAMAGPLQGTRSRQLLFGLSGISSFVEPAAIAGLFLIVLLVFALILLAFAPMEAATVPPGRIHAAIDWLMPGLSATWGPAFGIILLGWSLTLLTLVLQLAFRSPYYFTRITQQGMMRTFGHDSGFDDLNPPLIALIVVLAVLWMVNGALLFMRGRRLLR